MAAAFEDDVTQVLIPYLDSNFRTLPGRDHRAMAGHCIQRRSGVPWIGAPRYC